jgi:hypothetical protein
VSETDRYHFIYSFPTLESLQAVLNFLDAAKSRRDFKAVIARIKEVLPPAARGETIKLNPGAPYAIPGTNIKLIYQSKFSDLSEREKALENGGLVIEAPRMMIFSENNFDRFREGNVSIASNLYESYGRFALEKDGGWVIGNHTTVKLLSQSENQIEVEITIRRAEVRGGEDGDISDLYGRNYETSLTTPPAPGKLAALDSNTIIDKGEAADLDVLRETILQHAKNQKLVSILLGGSPLGLMIDRTKAPADQINERVQSAISSILSITTKPAAKPSTNLTDITLIKCPQQ